MKVRKDAPLELLGPLACSGQTGAGAVLNVIKPQPGESIAIFGVGAVGLSALMAARIAGCEPIIAVDVHDHRLALARDLGATHAINPKANGDVTTEIRKLTGRGVRYAIETSAVPAVFRAAVESLAPGGTCVLLGSAPKGSEVALEMPFLQEGRMVRGVIQGDSRPREFIPQLVDLIMQDKFPIEKMMTFYDFADINRAAAESSSGIDHQAGAAHAGRHLIETNATEENKWRRCRNLAYRAPICSSAWCALENSKVLTADCPTASRRTVSARSTTSSAFSRRRARAAR